MSNIVQTSFDNNEESRMSFVTVSSMIVGNEEKSKRQMNLHSHLSQNENNTQINSSLTETVIKESFEDLPLQISQERSKGKTIVPHLCVENKGDKKDYLGTTYKNYEVSLIDEKNEKRILCYRRYDNFYTFYQKLIKKFPCFIIPKLSGKNALTKIINDNEFFSIRTKQLNYFLNYLFNHEKMKTQRDFVKFINDPEFDEDHFKRDEILYDFQESAKFSDTIGNKIYGMFSGIFKAKEESIVPTDNELHLKKMEIFYKRLYDNMEQTKKNLISYINHIRRSGENYIEISNNFYYLKDVSFESQNSKEFFLRYYQLSGELGKINKLSFDEIGSLLSDRFEGFVSIVHGVCDAFERYFEFITMYHKVQRAVMDSRANPRNYNLPKLSKEFNKANEIRSNFETTLVEEVKVFVGKYSNEYTEILEHYKRLIQAINSNEMNKMQQFANYFK